LKTALAARLTLFSSVIDRAAMTDRQHRDDTHLVVQFADDAIVANPVAPQAELFVPQRLAEDRVKAPLL